MERKEIVKIVKETIAEVLKDETLIEELKIKQDEYVVDLDETANKLHTAYANMLIAEIIKSEKASEKFNKNVFDLCLAYRNTKNKYNAIEQAINDIEAGKHRK